MQFYGLRKYCDECGKEIVDGLKDIKMLKERYKIEKNLCIWCINKQEFEKR